MTTRTAEEHGFHLVDVRVTFETALDPARPPGANRAANDAVRIRPARTGDIPILQETARASYHDTRFYWDPGFPRRKCDRFYETWIAKSVDGWADFVLVAEAEAEPCGYVTCHLDRSSLIGKIGLVGVNNRIRGKGLGQLLVRSALDWFASNI